MQEFNWIANHFVSEQTHLKAVIKYDIKYHETTLKRLMFDSKTKHLNTKDAGIIAAKIAKDYEKLLKILNPSTPSKESVLLCGDTPARCYACIQALREEIKILATQDEEIKYYNELKGYYSYLESLLLNFHAEENLIETKVALSINLQDLIKIDSPEKWFVSVVNFANDLNENAILSLGLIAKLKDEELLNLADLFVNPEFILYVNNLFYYKFNPEQLFNEPIYAEKLISVRARLTMMHYFIERIHQVVGTNLSLRKIGDFKDYLFHGNEFPAGVSLEKDEEIKLFIYEAIKNWRVSYLANSSELDTLNKVNELFRVYKFWFNPNRLIDTCMALQRNFLSSDVKIENKKFVLKIQVIYQPLTTTQCLDLYGYFTNKDSNYLMRILLALSKGAYIPSLGEETNKYKDLFEEIYHVLDAIMEALRNELLERKIQTNPYNRELSSSILKPGARNLKAIKRIIELYADSNNKKQSEDLDNLFNIVEDKLTTK